MEECTDAYAEFVMEQYEEAKKSCKDPVILIEQKLDFPLSLEGVGAVLGLEKQKLTEGKDLILERQSQRTR